MTGRMIWRAQVELILSSAVVYQRQLILKPDHPHKPAVPICTSFSAGTLEVRPAFPQCSALEDQSHILEDSSDLPAFDIYALGIKALTQAVPGCHLCHTPLLIPMLFREGIALAAEDEARLPSSEDKSRLDLSFPHPALFYI